jgi:hypothetical protein
MLRVKMCQNVLSVNITTRLLFVNKTNDFSYIVAVSFIERGSPEKTTDLS